jgi:hypothetical protein
VGPGGLARFWERKVDIERAPIGSMEIGHRPQGAVVELGALLGGKIEDPARHRVRRIVRRHQTRDAIHHDERRAEH